MTVDQIVRISEFGKSYQDEFLSEFDTKLLEQDSWKALLFFFRCSFMRGRRDTLSGDFLKKAITVLEKISLNKMIVDNTISDFIQDEEWQENLKRKLHSGGVNNRVDRKMIVSTLIFLNEQTKDNNIVTYSTQKIRKGLLGKVYLKLDGVFGIGAKLASFFLRDLVCLYRLESYVEDDDLALLQPVDVWVDRVTERLGIIETNDLLEAKREKIVKACQQANVHPISFNQGCWYAGYSKKTDEILAQAITSV